MKVKITNRGGSSYAFSARDWRMIVPAYATWAGDVPDAVFPDFRKDIEQEKYSFMTLETEDEEVLETNTRRSGRRYPKPIQAPPEPVTADNIQEG